MHTVPPCSWPGGKKQKDIYIFLILNCLCDGIRRNETQGSFCSALLAAVLPSEFGAVSAGPCQKQLRIRYKSQDWVKWGLAVRKDPSNWLGQVSLPLLIGLEKPAVMCSVVRCGADGLSHKLILHWSLKETSNKLLLCVGSMLWQYRWRWFRRHSDHDDDGDGSWVLGPIKKCSPVDWGNYCSAPLVGEWTSASNGAVEMSVRYSANPTASPEATLSLACSVWSEWSASTGEVELAIPPPKPGEQDLEVSLDDHNPCEAKLTWRSFRADVGYRLEYRVLLTCPDDRVSEDWELVAWWEDSAERTEAFVQNLAELKKLGQKHAYMVQGSELMVPPPIRRGSVLVLLLIVTILIVIVIMHYCDDYCYCYYY